MYDIITSFQTGGGAYFTGVLHAYNLDVVAFMAYLFKD